MFNIGNPKNGVKRIKRGLPNPNPPHFTCHPCTRTGTGPGLLYIQKVKPGPAPDSTGFLDETSSPSGVEENNAYVEGSLYFYALSCPSQSACEIDVDFMEFYYYNWWIAVTFIHLTIWE
jgi:hypothetical protein